ncbi:MAG: hypothetical protein K8R67_18310 [Desulfobacteraceae bacterium]|nr:hypothetical protein [Desulfobacteraceae bacterium]
MIFQNKNLSLNCELNTSVYSLGKITKVCVCVQICLLISCVFNSYAKATSQDISQENSVQNVQMITPLNDSVVYDKKPMIECNINIPYVKESLYVEFDMTDVSALIRLDGTLFEFRPVQVIQPGNHQLTVVFTTLDGEQVMEQFQFTTRHSKWFETAYSRNTASVGYTRIIKKYQDAKDREMSAWEAAANFGTENFLAQGPWSFSFKANGRYYDEEIPIEEPLEDNLELVDFLFIGKYQKSKYMLETSVGDVLINESRNTVDNLARRGGKLVAEYGVAGFSGFVVRSDTIYGSDGDYGLELDDKDHIFGAVGDLDLFKNRANIKAIYVSGGTEADDESFGQWDTAGGTKGDVKGVILTTDFFERKLYTTFEFDRSNYDSDTADTINAKSDKAYLFRAEGCIGKFHYWTEYEYTGLYYKVPGNFHMNDWEGYTISGDLTFEKQSVLARYTEHNHDVEHDSPYGRTNFTTYNFEYRLNIFSTVPMEFRWFRMMEENQVQAADSIVDTYSSNISYMKDTYSLFFTPSYSKTNDRTDADFDSSSLNLNLSASYFKEVFSIQPSIGFNRYKDFQTDVYTDTDTYGLAVTVVLLKNISINNTSSFSNITASDDTVDQDYYSNDFQMTYTHPKRIWGIFSPKASLGASYGKTKDRIMDIETEETIVYMTLSGDFEISF